MALNGQQLPFHHCRHLAHSMDMKDKPIDEALRTFQKLSLMPVSKVIVCTYMFVHVCIHGVYMRTVYVHVCVCMCICVCTRVYTWCVICVQCLCMCVVCTCMCTCVCMCVCLRGYLHASVYPNTTCTVLYI